MAFDPKLWKRRLFEGLPIYIRPDRPDWFVPNRSGDHFLQRLLAGDRSGPSPLERRFLLRLPGGEPIAYPGRDALLATDRLRELWFHVTDNCNMSCRHCLVSSSPSRRAMLGADRILELAREAAGAGCSLFVLTGGEPFAHPRFEEIVEGLLALNGAHVVVLTNGSLIGRRREALSGWPGDRFHLQISLDGLRESHDRLRGAGAFERLRANLEVLRTQGRAFTISMCVMQANLAEMPGIVDFAGDEGASNVHFLWYFIRGRGGSEDFAAPERILPHLREAARHAAERGISIDNIDSFRTRVFSPPGTIHDGGNSGWESLAVGPDDNIYPTPALLGIEDLATPLQGGLLRSWRASPVLERLRSTTAKDSSSPLRFIVGGGDPDHCYVHSGSFSGADPYLPLHDEIALWLIAEEAMKRSDDGPPRLRLKMGDILEQCGEGGEVELVHSNCLLALASKGHVAAVKEFYSSAVASPREDILNPVFYPDELVSHIPRDCLVRSYGCGSPVLDAGLVEGERVVDLGSGTGVECLIASRMVGKRGLVTGIDMLDPMLELANKGADAVSRTLGYSNVRFKKGYLESLPLESESADVVLSNCVLNLSGDKRSTFAEIARVLAVGGRLVVSDVVCESEPPAAIRNDSVLKGECIAGALTQRDLAGLLEESGFTSLRIIKKLPYRLVRDHPFFSLTFEARKASMRDGQAEWTTDSGSDSFFEVTEDWRSIDWSADPVGCSCAEPQEPSACCGSKPGPVSSCCGTEQQAAPPRSGPPSKRSHGCMVCGAPLVYRGVEREAECFYCHEPQRTSALCENGHFVCDGCHAEDGLRVIKRICLETDETDLIKLLERIRSDDSIPMHGPEHHALVPGVILATYRNLGGAITDEDIRTGIKRGSIIPGGFCGFAGSCGAAIGVGVAFGIILDSNPLKRGKRAAVLSTTSEVMARISRLEAARCCQRESFIALMTAAELSRRLLPTPLRAEAALICRQSRQNEECIKARCPVVMSTKQRK